MRIDELKQNDLTQLATKPAYARAQEYTTKETKPPSQAAYKYQVPRQTAACRELNVHQLVATKTQKVPMIP